MSIDVIDHLAGIAPGSALDELRRRRPRTREYAQRSYEALFGQARPDLLALAAFVATLHEQPAVARFYAERLDPGLAESIRAEAEAARTTGPYGAYREPELAAENVLGPVYQAAGPFGERMNAAFTHAHLLVLRPREASPEALEALAKAGWSTDEIVTVAQLVAFLAFQIRVISALRGLR
ncbi:CMD domain protein [Nonomuraea sp. NPDC050310]|uniref:CMD domain protein n=1 Tax=unclassified Nonomuraea TaxID=2593643 RepID=UPI0033F68217